METPSNFPVKDHLPKVGPFTGWTTFLRKEIRDWLKSWRLIVVLVIFNLIMSGLVFFAYPEFANIARKYFDSKTAELIATQFLANYFRQGMLVLMIFTIIFASMGLLTVEKSTGTLAWNLTKPLGRTGLFFAKWLSATSMLWLSMIVIPMCFGFLAMALYRNLIAQFVLLVPLMVAAFGWIGIWVLLILTISLGFRSQAAVGAITIAFWAVPNLLSLLIGEIIGKEPQDWLLNHLGTNAPFWAFEIFIDPSLTTPIDAVESHKSHEIHRLWIYVSVSWFVLLAVISQFIFTKQEISS